MLIKSSAARVLCFGDSNTYGMRPDNWLRYSVQQRWTGLVQKELGDTVDIIEEGLSGRTTDLDNPEKPGRNGKTYLTPCLLSHNFLDGVVVMLGTNDCKTQYNRTAEDIAQALGGLVADIRRFGISPHEQPPKILLVCPVPLAKTAANDPYMSESSVETSKALKESIAALAKATDCDFFDAGSVAEVGEDGIHLTLEAHASLAKALAPRIRGLV